MVDRNNRDHIHAGAAHENFLGGVKLSAVDQAFDHGHAHLFLKQYHQGIARDAFEDAGRHWRSTDLTAAHHH